MAEIINRKVQGSTILAFNLCTIKTVPVVVIGAGVVGFSSAVSVAESLPFCAVTLVADKFTPDTTSDGAAGMLLTAPYPDIPLERQKQWFKDTFDHLLDIAQSQHSTEAGVLLSSGYQISKEVPSEQEEPYWAGSVIGFRLMTGCELERFPHHKFGQAFTTIKCECSSYLPWLERRFRRAGGQVVQMKVNHLQELASSYNIIVNCSGLGSRSLLGDEAVYPVRGQVLKVRAPWLQNFIRDADGKTYIYPGVHSVTLGGTRQEGDWRLDADPGDTEGILERCCQLEPSLRQAPVLSQWVGLRPARRSPRVERELLWLQGRQVPVVHNYGHGAWGVSMSWGTALEALGLVRQCLYEMPLQAKL